MERGKLAISALADFRQAKEEKNEEGMQRARQVLDENMPISDMDI